MNRHGSQFPDLRACFPCPGLPCRTTPSPTDPGSAGPCHAAICREKIARKYPTKEWRGTLRPPLPCPSRPDLARHRLTAPRRVGPCPGKGTNEITENMRTARGFRPADLPCRAEPCHAAPRPAAPNPARPCRATFILWQPRTVRIAVANRRTRPVARRLSESCARPSG